MATTRAATTRDMSAEVVFLTRALKAPTLRESVSRLAERARSESWTHEEFLVACLQREVSARESHGGEGRIKAARFPARKSLEEFDFEHARGLKRDLIAHVRTQDPRPGRRAAPRRCRRCRAVGSAWYSVPSCNATMTKSAPSSAARAASRRTRSVSTRSTCQAGSGRPVLSRYIGGNDGDPRARRVEHGRIR